MPDKAVVDSSELRTVKDVAALLQIPPIKLHYILKRNPTVTVIQLGRVQAIRNEDIPTLSGILTELNIRKENQAKGLTPDGTFWGSRRTATALGMSPWTLRRQTEAGKIPGHRDDRNGHPSSWRWDPQEIARLVAERE
jgi:hypothetical protein